jgi:hypothetical protein
MKAIEVTERLTIEAPGPGEVGHPLIHVEATDVEDRAVIVYGEEIRHLAMALSEAAGVPAEVWGR